ncbi:unnamed protein product [Caenorhabditis nigoni]
MADGLGNRRWKRMFCKRHVEDFLKHINEYDGPTTHHSEATQSPLPSFPILRRGFMVDEQQNKSSFFGGVRCFRQPQPPTPSTNNNPQIGTVSHWEAPWPDGPRRTRTERILNCFGDYWRLFTRRTPRQLENVPLQELEEEPQTNLTVLSDNGSPPPAEDLLTQSPLRTPVPEIQNEPCTSQSLGSLVTTDKKHPKITNEEHQPWFPSATEDPDAVREQETYL